MKSSLSTSALVQILTALNLFFIPQSTLAAPEENKSLRPKIEIRTSPGADIANWVNLDIAFLPDPNFAFGFSYINYANQNVPVGNIYPAQDGFAYGLNIVYAESLQQHAAYVSFHTYVEKYKAFPDRFSGYYDYSGTRANAIIGRRWVIDNFVTMIGIGLENKDHSYTITPTTGPSSKQAAQSTFFTAEFKIGYLF